jgi:hypothetical protein
VWLKGGHGIARNDHSFHTSHIPESLAVPAVSSPPTLSVVDDCDPLLGELAEVPAAPAGLLQTPARVADPRKARGIRHALPGVLTVALASVVAGARSFVAIAKWATDATPEVLAQLGMPPKVPSESTIRRCLQRLAPDQLDQLLGAWTWLHTSEIGGRGDRVRRQDTARRPRCRREPGAPAVRGVAFAEDHSQNRTGSGRQVIAMLRNTLIGLLRLDSPTNIAAALRHHARVHHRPLKILLNW